MPLKSEMLWVKIWEMKLSESPKIDGNYIFSVLPWCPNWRGQKNVKEAKMDFWKSLVAIHDAIVCNAPPKIKGINE